MQIKAIVALVCPSCGYDLTGLDTDAVFGCTHCGVGYRPGSEGLVGPYPVREVQYRGAGPSVYLPFWKLALAPLLLPDRVSPIDVAYVPGFDLRRRTYFGDPGLRWTVDRVAFEATSGGTPLKGLALSVDEAIKLGRYSVLRAIDQQLDITGFDHDIQFQSDTAEIILVGFGDEGRALIDPVTGHKYPAPAFCDLPMMRD